MSNYFDKFDGDKPSGGGNFFDQFDEPPAGARPTAADYLKGVGAGVGGLVSGIGYLAERAGANQVGGDLRFAGDEAQKAFTKSMTPAGQRAAQSQVFEDDPGSVLPKLGDRWGQALAMGAAQSAPSMVAAALPGGLAATGIRGAAGLAASRGIGGALAPLAAGTAAPVGGWGANFAGNLAARAPSALGFGAAEGAVAGSSNAAQWKSDIEQKPEAELDTMPGYAALKAQVGPVEARRQIADKGAADIMARTTLATGGIGALTGGGALGSGLQRLTTGAKGGILRAIGRDAGEEAMQEIPQSGGERLIQNLATRDYLDPQQSITQGVLADALSGGAIGAAMGGSMGGGSHLIKGPMQKAAESGSANLPPDSRQVSATFPPQAAPAPPGSPTSPASATQPPTDGGSAGASVARADASVRDVVQAAEAEMEADRAPSAPAAAPQNTPAAPVSPPSPVSAAAPSPQSNQAEPAGVPVSQPQEGAAPRGNQAEVSQPATPGQPAQPVEGASAAESVSNTGTTPVAAPAGQDVNLQNRDRSRTASVIQMIDIARNPDYMRLGPSRTPDSGAPMVFSVGDDHSRMPATNFGNPDVAVMSDGQRVPFRYAVVDASQVEPSHFADGRVNPAFASGQTGTIKALNNGRTAGLRAAYELGTAGTYQTELAKDLANVGIPPEALQATPNPILVRIYSDSANTAGMAAKSQAQGLGMSPAELARQDAPLLDSSVLELFQPGDVASADNRDFVRAFVGKLQQSGQDIAGMMTDAGTLAQLGRQRIQAALMQAAYGEVDLVAELFDSIDTDIKAIGEALKTVAGAWANMRDSARAGAIAAEVDITGNIIAAVRLIQKARRERISLFDLVNQRDIETGETVDDLTAEALRLFYTGRHLTRPTSKEALIANLGRYLEMAMATSAGADMFGERVEARKLLQAITKDGADEGIQGERDPAGVPVAGAGSGGERPETPGQGVHPGGGSPAPRGGRGKQGTKREEVVAAARPAEAQASPEEAAAAMAAVAARHGHNYEEALAKIIEHPARWKATVDKWIEAERQEKLANAKAARNAAWKPNNKQLRVLRLVSDNSRFSKDNDVPMAAHLAASARTLIARNLLSRVELDDVVEYRVSAKAADFVGAASEAQASPEELAADEARLRDAAKTANAETRAKLEALADRLRAARIAAIRAAKSGSGQDLISRLRNAAKKAAGDRRAKLEDLADRLEKQKPQSAAQSQENPAPNQGSEVIPEIPEGAAEAAQRHGLPADTEWIRGRGLGKNEWAAYADGIKSNYYASADDAARELRQWIDQSKAAKKEAERHAAVSQAAADKIRRGEQPTDAEWKIIFHGEWKEGFRYVRQPVASEFLTKFLGVPKHRIRANIGEAAGTLTSDFGAKYPIVYPNRLVKVFGQKQAEVPRSEGVSTGAEARPALDLQGQTPAELAAAEAAAKAKSEEEARASQEAEKSRKDAEARAETKRRSEAAAETFELGGDAMANLSGQRDMLSGLPPAEPTSKAGELPAAEASTANTQASEPLENPEELSPDAGAASDDLGALFDSELEAAFSKPKEEGNEPGSVRNPQRDREATDAQRGDAGALSDERGPEGAAHGGGVPVPDANRRRGRPGGPGVSGVGAASGGERGDQPVSGAKRPAGVEKLPAGDNQRQGSAAVRPGGVAASRGESAAAVGGPAGGAVGRSASAAGKSAAKNAGLALADVAKGLNALFKPKPGQLGTGLPFDEDTYAAAKPYFQAGLEHFRQAGADIVEMMRALIAALRDQFGMDKDTIAAMKPYVLRYISDVQAGRDAIEETKPQQLPKDKLQQQQAAESIKVIVGDKANIDATLPFLTEGQREDVLFAEKRWAAPDGYGVLFTNGTGTGKTFLALGAIKRLTKQGKGNGIIVVPNEAVMNEWVKSAPALGLQIKPLTDTQDAGSGIAITTYANFGQNDEIAKRDYDFVAIDEAHLLMLGKDAEPTKALDALRAVSLHPDGVLQRAEMQNRELVDRISTTSDQLKSLYRMMNNPDIMDQMYAAYRAEVDGLEKKLAADRAKWKAVLEAVESDVMARQGEKRTRAIFLSATPFAYEPSIQWGEGYLYEFPKVSGRGYNAPNGYQQFMMQHFGWRMRNGKLNKPPAEVDSDLMQRQFNTWLRNEGVLSARMLDVDFDYERKFILIQGGVGQTIDDGLRWLRETDNGRYWSLYGAINEQFDYLTRSRLLEAIKARAAIPYIKKHHALGRKVVVFYDFNSGGGINVFNLSEQLKRTEAAEKAPDYSVDRDGVDVPVRGQGKAAYGQIKREKVPLSQLIREFMAARPELQAIDFSRHGSPLTTLLEAFPGAGVYNGMSQYKKTRVQSIRDFNDDAKPEANLLLVQKAANAGWSGHDTTGKHGRVLINLGLPVAPIEAIQEEGRIYRVGQKSDANFQYFNTGTNWERYAFGSKIARRAGTAENLAMGEQARGLREAFIQAFENSDPDYEPGAADGKGGKTGDRDLVGAITEWDRARSLYFAQQKKTSRTKAAEGVDYYATPEPLGLKMVEWAGILTGESVLEPSAGHGAIARWFPEKSDRTVIEPSLELASRLTLATDAKLINERFEGHDTINKYDAIVMNPPFGVGGKTAIEHLDKAFRHLADGGRVVALIPEGPTANKRFEDWLYGDKQVKAKPVANDVGAFGAVFLGDTATVEVSGMAGIAGGVLGTGTVTAKVTGSREGKLFVKREGEAWATGYRPDQIRAVQPTGARTTTVKSAPNAYLRASIGLPGVTFERAGTGVKTRVVIIDKIEGMRASRTVETQPEREIEAATVKELFDRLENMEVVGRSLPAHKEQEKQQGQERSAAKDATAGKVDDVGLVQPEGSPATVEEVQKPERPGGRQKLLTDAPRIKHVVASSGKELFGVIAKRLTRNEAKAVDPYSWPKDGGFFIRMEHVIRPPSVAEQERAVYNVHEPDGITGDLFQGTTQDLFAGTNHALPTEARSNLHGKGQAPKGNVRSAARPASRVLAVRQAPDAPGVYHVSTQLVTVGERALPVDRIHTADDAAKSFAYLSRHAVEHYDAIVTDKNGRPLAVIGSFKGALTQTNVYPGTVVAELSRIDGAAHLWTAHNHPSGTSELSYADENLSRQFATLLDGTGVQYHGLFAMANKAGRPGVVAYSHTHGDRGEVDRNLPPVRRVPIVERELIDERNPGDYISSYAVAEAVVPQIAGSNPGIVFLDAQNRTAAFVPFSGEELGRLKADGRLMRLFRSVSQSNAGAAIVAMPDGKVTKQQVGNVLTALTGIDVRALDAIEYTSDGLPTSSLTSGKPRSLAAAGEMPSVEGMFFSREGSSLSDDLEQQERWLSEKASDAGFSSIDDMVFRDYKAFERLAQTWRNEHPADVLYSAGKTSTKLSGYSAADRAVFAMAMDGRPSTEILSFLSKASRSPFNRVLAQVLLRLGVAPSVAVELRLHKERSFSKNGAEGYAAAAYDPTTDSVFLFNTKEAERHFLHELVHAATLKAIAAGGPSATRMRALFRHVQKSGRLTGQYGLTSVDEFVTEAFTNPEFQEALRNLHAPAGSALKSAWNWFVRIVARAIGIKTQASETALERTLSEGAALMQENMALSATGNRGTFDPSNPDIRFSEDRQTVSTRVPTARSPAGDYLRDGMYISLKSMQRNNDSFTKNVRAMQEYPNYRPAPSANTPEAIAQRIIAHLASNLIWLYDRASDAVRQRGRLWYDGARKIAEQMADQYGYTVNQVAGVIARLSPQMDWFTNASLAERVIDAMRFRQDFRWDAEMDRVADRIYPGGMLAEIAQEIRGKSLREVADSAGKAAWIRAYDEAHNPRSYRTILPEGEFSDFATKDRGGLRSVMWGSLDMISSAVDILEDGSIENISRNLGSQHKIRSFYNNIVDPNSPDGHVTIDTHAVAAAHIRPLDGSSTEVLQNFGGKGSAKDSVNGLYGTYPIYAEAYRRAAAARGILPREMQSVAWEAARGLFSAAMKRNRNAEAAADRIWESYKKGRLSLENARNQIFDLAGGIDEPVWVGHPAGQVDALQRSSSYKGELPRTGLPRRDPGSVDGGAGGGLAARNTGGSRRGDVAPPASLDLSNPDLRFSVASGGAQTPPVTPGNLWQAAKAKAAALLTPERLDKVIYELQDKYIDLRRIRDYIREIGGTITDLNDAYLGEELYHKRLAHRTEDFLKDELRPLLADMKAQGVSMQEFETFLHARHAPEANAEMARRNPNQQEIDAGRLAAARTVHTLERQLAEAQARGAATKAIEQALNDARGELVKWNGAQAFSGTEQERRSLSGMTDQAAAAAMSGLSPERRAALDALAARVDAINAGTLRLLEGYGLMSRDSLDSWRQTYQFYVPLHRDEAHPDSTSHPIGQGFSVKGEAAKRRTGSNQKVTNILGHIAMQREAALTRGEKNRVMLKLYLMARQNPLPDVWKVGSVPMVDTIDKATGFVKSVADPLYRNRPNVVTLRIAGKDVSVTMNEHNPQALRMAQALKNLDVDDLHYIIPVVGKMTRYFAAINTQYNPIFGLINLMRDAQEAALNLSTTELAGKQKQVMRDALGILGEVVKNKGRMPTGGQWGRLFDEFNEVGGTTGYRDLYLNAEERAKALLSELRALGRGQVSKAAHAVADWLSDYNEAMENAVRLAAYKSALDQGLSKERAASLAKNLTVNFNRKGRQTRELGALYAFFNAAVQGTTRMAQTLAGPAGRKIMAGGVLLGALNALLGIAAMGGGDGEDDEYDKIPEFVKERSIIIPVGKQDYIAIPMPLGFQFLPNIGRLAVEMAVYKDKTAGKQMASLFTVLADAFNPLGGSAPALQIVAPTVLDPFVALAQNRDWTGRPIYVENFNSLNPEPGTKRAKDSATPWAKGFAEAINAVTGGTQYVAGGWSPTPDQIDYLIGQLTGGIGREAGKVAATASAPFTGEELPPYKIPLVGRLYGSTAGHSGQSAKFYENITMANEADNEIKGRLKDGVGIADFLKESPHAIELAALGNAAERQVRELRGIRRGILSRGEPDATARAREINERMAEVMRNFNRQAGTLQ